MDPFRYAREGPEAQGDTDLVALALAPVCSSRPPSEHARVLLDCFGSLARLVDAPVGALAEAAGLAVEQLVPLHAALVAGRRAAVEAASARPLIDTPEAAAAWFRPRFAGLSVEELHAAYLDRSQRVLHSARLSRGNDACTVVDPRQVLRLGVQVGAASLVVAHNHPSGDPTPSALDRDVTRRLEKAAELLDVPLLDHLVLGRPGHCSMAEAGDLSRPRQTPRIFAT